MTARSVLYISGSLGLGHIIRDLEIAKAMRILNPDVEVSWLAAHPASDVIIQAGETLHPEAKMYADDNIPAENAAEEGFRLNILKYLMKAMGEWEQNVKAFERVVIEDQFDLVMADEAYEIAVALANKDVSIDIPFVMMYDFIGNNSMSWNPMEVLGTYMWNREWAKTKDFYQDDQFTALFIGEPDDIPDTRLGPFLPNRRELAKEICQFVGYVLPFDPSNYSDNAKIRSKLGYNQAPLIVCSIGGTSVGKDLLTLCGKAYELLKTEIPELQMTLVCGPRLASENISVPQGVEIKGYIPKLYEHFAASDLAIVQAGGTMTLELTALRKPFLYFPLDGHFEQQIHVAGRLARHKAGVRMSYLQTTPDSLAKEIKSNLAKDVNYPAIAVDGAQKAAKIINQLL